MKSVGVLLSALLLALAACGGGSGGNGQTDTGGPQPDAAGDIGLDVTVPDSGGDEDIPVVPDSKDDLGQQDVPPPEDTEEVVDTTDTADTGCACQTAADCEGEAIGACEEWVCEECVCSVQRTTEAPACCETDAECDDGNEETRDTCPVAGEACLNRACDCMVDSNCPQDDPALNACQEWICQDECTCIVDETGAPDCCLEDADCDDGDPETEECCPVPGGACNMSCDFVCTAHDQCVGRVDSATACDNELCNLATGACYASPVTAFECCLSAADCDDGNELTDDTCPVPGEACLHTATTVECATSVTPFSVTFDSGTLEGFQLFDYNTSDDVTWQAVEENARAGKALYLGAPTCGWYFNGPDVDENCETPYAPVQDGDYATQVYVELFSPEIQLPADSGGTPLAFRLGFWVVGESATPPTGMPPGFTPPDTLVISVVDLSEAGQPETQVFTSEDYLNVVPELTYITADLTSFAGHTIKLRVLFDTYDGVDNRHPGWWLDEMEITTFCEAVQCTTDNECRDALGCTIDECTPFETQGTDAGVCAGQRMMDCVDCLIDDDCAGQRECRIGTCNDDLYCDFAYDLEPPCCVANFALDEDFQSGTMPVDWTVEGDGSNVQWQVYTDGDTLESSLFFGDAATLTYANGVEQVQGSVTSTELVLPDPATTVVPTVVVAWDLFLSTEFDDIPFSPEIPIDNLTMSIIYDDGGVMVEDILWDSRNIEGTTNDEWISLGVDITDYAGRTVYIKFTFDSYDGNENIYPGPWIDNLVVRSVCGDACGSDAECDDGDACTDDACIGLLCEHTLAYKDCCETVEDCLEPDECTAVSCEDNTCTYVDDLDDTTCCDGASWIEAVEDPDLTGYTVTIEDYGDPVSPVTWLASPLCAATGEYGLYFGDPDYEHYYTGFRVGGSILTPEMTVPSSGADAKTWLTFQLWLDTEWNGSPRENWDNPPGLQRDALRVYAVRPGQETKVWDSYTVDLRGSTCDEAECGWATVEIDVTDYQRQPVRFRFEFDSFDDIDNMHLGACIDDIELVVGCDASGFQCFWSEDCDDEDQCTADVCADHTCDYTPLSGPNCYSMQPVGPLSNWDDGTAQGWDLGTSSSPVAWNVSDVLAYSGSYALYFGDPVTQTYEDGSDAVAGIVYSPPSLELPAGNERIELRFWYYVDIEQYDESFPNNDQLEITIQDNFSPASATILTKLDIPPELIGVDPPVWTEYVVDITDFAGADVAFEIWFDSGDGFDNGGLGVLIDDWQVWALLPN